MSLIKQLQRELKTLEQSVKALYCYIQDLNTPPPVLDDYTTQAVLDPSTSVVTFNRFLGGSYTIDLSNLGEHPVYVGPTATITNVSNTYEVGQIVPITINLSFTQNDAGAPVSTSIIRNGATVSSTNTFTEALSVPLGNTVYGGSVTYSQGACKFIGTFEDCTGRIEAGTVNAVNRTVIGGYRRYAGSVAAVPTSGANLRSTLLSTSVINTSNSFTFTTGTTNRRFVIAIPSTKNLVNVTNTGTNEDLTTGFVLSSITTVPDAAGTPVTYKVYVAENAVAFSMNYILQVTLN